MRSYFKLWETPDFGGYSQPHYSTTPLYDGGKWVALGWRTNSLGKDRKGRLVFALNDFINRADGNHPLRDTLHGRDFLPIEILQNLFQSVDWVNRPRN